MAIAQPPHQHPSSSTYMARAIPQPGPNTTEFQAVRDDRPCPGWPPQHHQPLIALGAAAAAVAVPLLITYAFIADDPDTARAGRTLLLSAGLVLAVLAGCCGIAMLVVRSHDRAIIQGAEYGVGEVHRLESLHGELQAVSTHMAATVARLESVLGERVDAMERRVEAVEQRDSALVSLPEELRDRVDRQAIGYQALVKEIGDRISGRIADVAERVEAVEQQCSATERGDQNDDRYLAGYADGLAGRMAQDGNVVPFNGSRGTPSADQGG